jgi:hypothetical protein
MEFDKVIKKIGCFISDFVSEINSDIEITFDNYSYCYTDVPTIVVGLYIAENDIDKLHQKYYQENGFDYDKFNIDFKTFTLLHELGHIQSKTTPKEEKEHYAKQKEINDSVKLDNKPLNDTLLKYFNLPLEKRADQWAWNYLIDNIYTVKLFDSLFKKLIKELKESE